MGTHPFSTLCWMWLVSNLYHDFTNGNPLSDRWGLNYGTTLRSACAFLLRSLGSFRHRCCFRVFVFFACLRKEELVGGLVELCVSTGSFLHTLVMIFVFLGVGSLYYYHYHHHHHHHHYFLFNLFDVGCFTSAAEDSEHLKSLVF